MRVKTNELTGAPLDWAVAKCEGLLAFGYRKTDRFIIELSDGEFEEFCPSTDWAQGGPIIQREELSSLKCYSTNEWGCLNGEVFCEGPTPLIAAMRCYVASKLGDEVEIPEELK